MLICRWFYMLFSKKYFQVHTGIEVLHYFLKAVLFQIIKSLLEAVKLIFQNSIIIKPYFKGSN